MFQTIKMRVYLLTFIIFLIVAYNISTVITPESYFFVFLPTICSAALFYIHRRKYKKIKALNDFILYAAAALVAMGKALHQLNAVNKPIGFIIDTISFNINIVTFFIFLVILKGIIALYEFKSAS
ncbi:hypothetical protein ACVST5_20600 [Yersinia enterocolitica]